MDLTFVCQSLDLRALFDARPFRIAQCTHHVLLNLLRPSLPRVGDSSVPNSGGELAQQSSKLPLSRHEMQAVPQAMSGGWRADTVKPGDKVSVEYLP